MTFRQCAALLVIAVFVTASPLMAQDVRSDKKRSRLHEVSSVSLKGDARSAFRRFKRKARYFGAFYANPAEQVAGAYWDASNIETAESVARTACEGNSRDPWGCVLVARVLPRDYDPERAGLTLSRKGNKEFREYSRLQAEDRFGAFAMSENGAVGYSWAEASQFAAEREALKRCEKAVRKLLRRTPDHMQDAVTNPGNKTCRIVHRAG